MDIIKSNSKAFIFLVLSLSLLLLLPSISALSTTGTVDWNSNVGQIRSDFYGINLKGERFIYGNNNSLNEFNRYKQRWSFRYCF